MRRIQGVYAEKKKRKKNSNKTKTRTFAYINNFSYIFRTQRWGAPCEERERQTGVNFNYAIQMYGNVIHKITITSAVVGFVFG